MEDNRRSTATYVGTHWKRRESPIFLASFSRYQRLRPPATALRQNDEQGGDELRNFAAEVVLFPQCMLRYRRLELTVRQPDQGHRVHQLRQDLENLF